MLVLRESDGITMNRDRLLADAKAKALALRQGLQAAGAAADPPARPHRRRGARPGASTIFAWQGKATTHDLVVAGRWPMC